MTNQNNAAQPVLTDDQIEALAKKHIAPHADRLDAIMTNPVPYQQTEQFRRVKALIVDVLSKLRAEGVQAGDERAAFAAIAKRRAAEVAAMNIADGHGRFLNAQGHQQAISALDFCVAQFSALPGSLAGGNWRDEFSRRVYEDLAAADNQDVPLEEYPARILGVLDALESAPVADERAALAWYAEQVAGCRKIGADGDAARQALDKDGGRRARAALASAPVADESPMAKMADALREKARQEQQAYQDRRNQATEWGPIPEGTEADSAHVADEWVLPPLPAAWGSAINDAGDGHVDLYSAEQMQEYARAHAGAVRSVLASAPVAGEAQERIEQMAVNRYRPVPDGKFSYKVVAGDGSRSLYTGTKDSCLRVAAKLTEAFLDGAFVASDAAPQASEAVRPRTCQPGWGAKK